MIGELRSAKHSWMPQNFRARGTVFMVDDFGWGTALRKETV
jgi:hypothetical protein